MIQVWCGAAPRRTSGRRPWPGVRLFMNSRAPMVAARMRAPTSGRVAQVHLVDRQLPAWDDTPTMIARGTNSWATATPMLPPAAFRPRAQPFFRSG